MHYLFRLCLLLALCGSLHSFAQPRPGSIKGKITDKETGESIPLADLALYDTTGTLICAVQSDFEGNYAIPSVPANTYKVVCKMLGYNHHTITGVIIRANMPTLLNIALTPSTEELQEVMIVYDRPLIEKGKTTSIVSAERIDAMAVRDVRSVAAQTPGVKNDAQGSITVRGARAESEVTFVNGVRVQGHVDKAIAFQLGLTLDSRAVAEGEQYNSVAEIPFRTTVSRPLSTFSSDVDVAAYANVRRFLSDGHLPPKDAIRLEEMVNYFKYNYPAPAADKKFGVLTDLAPCPWNPKHKLLRIGIQTEKPEVGELPPNNLVFLIDVSGSMSSSNKLPLLKKSLRMLINQMRPEDNISIVVYASASGLVLPPTSGKHKVEILEALEALNAGGSTAGGAGIQLAYATALKHFDKGANNRVILATDGDFNVGVSSQQALIDLIEEKREDGIFLTVLGFGTGNYQDGKMEQLANHGNGNYAYIDNLMEAQKVLVNEMGANLHTVAKDTKFQIEFNPEHVLAYRLIGYENRQLNDEDFNDDTKDAGDVGSGHSVTALYELIPTGASHTAITPDVDSLRYQKAATTTAANSGELATLKLRYKEPDKRRSQLEVHTIGAENNIQENTDFDFVCAVLQLGMLLRDSEFKGSSNYESTITLAKAGKGHDPYGYRGEFIRLAELARDLDVEKAVGSR
jgi:Ca-activated chloride channel family protein